MKHNTSSLQVYGQLVLAELSKYLNKSQAGEGPVLRQENPEKIAQKLDLNHFIKNGMRSQDEFNLFTAEYLSYTQGLQHPHYIGHQTSVPHINSAFADFIHGLINNPMSIYEMGPSAAVLERYVINWMLSKVNWFHHEDLSNFNSHPKNGSGILTHGGSLANLTALLTARANSSKDIWQEGINKALVVLAPSTSHYSVSRSISIMGLGENAVVPVRVNKEEVMMVDDLLKKVNQARSDNKTIMAIVANACATTTGLYDPIDEIGSFCLENQIWFHVDGSHGAAALLSEPDRYLMKGVEKANSVIWDAHKMLRTSCLCAAVLYRDPAQMAITFQQKASYLFREDERPGFDILSYQVECTKAALGSKLFFALAAEGEQSIGKEIEELFAITKVFYHLIQQQDDFDCPYVPESNILCFRYTAGKPDNKYQLALRNQLVMEGNFYITSSEMNEIRYLRLSVMNPLTKEKHIKVLLNEIRKIAGKMG